MPDACQSNAVIVIVPVPLPDISPSAAIPLGTGNGQRPLLLAAPENPYYRPVSFNSVRVFAAGYILWFQN